MPASAISWNAESPASINKIIKCWIPCQHQQKPEILNYKILEGWISCQHLQDPGMLNLIPASTRSWNVDSPASINKILEYWFSCQHQQYPGILNLMPASTRSWNVESHASINKILKGWLSCQHLIHSYRKAGMQDDKRKIIEIIFGHPVGGGRGGPNDGSHLAVERA